MTAEQRRVQWPSVRQRPVNDLAWQERAACIGAEPEMFFDGRTEEALAVCGRCPVIMECRAYATRERFGIWGGRRRSKREPGNTRLTADQVAAARRKHARGTSAAKIAADLGISRAAADDMLSGRSWPDAGGLVRKTGHVSNAKLTPARVRQIRRMAAAGAKTPRLAKQHKLTQSTISQLLRGVTWPDAGGPPLRYDRCAKRWVERGES